MGLPGYIGKSIADEYFDPNELDSEERAFMSWKKSQEVNGEKKIQNKTLNNPFDKINKQNNFMSAGENKDFPAGAKKKEFSNLPAYNKTKEIKPTFSLLSNDKKEMPGEKKVREFSGKKKK